MNKIEQELTDFITQEFLGGESDKLTSSTPLMAAGILDSLGAIMVVELIETRFGVKVEANEADAEHMGTIQLMAQLVERKQAAAAG